MLTGVGDEAILASMGCPKDYMASNHRVPGSNPGWRVYAPIAQMAEREYLSLLFPMLFESKREVPERLHWESGWKPRSRLRAYNLFILFLASLLFFYSFIKMAW